MSKELERSLSTEPCGPNPAAGLVPRPRLIHRLQLGLDNPMTLLAAPTGYGKTTLVRAWVDECDIPCAWLALDKINGTLQAFLGILVAAVRTVFPAALPQTFALSRTAALPSPEVLTGTITNEIDALPQRLVLVLDNYGDAGSRHLDQPLSEILRHPPQALHLVLICAHDPDLPLPRLRAQGQMVELRSEDLRFTPDEIESYLRSATGTSSPEMVDRLAAHTEGWIASLQLAVRSLNAGKDPTERARPGDAGIAGTGEAFERLLAGQSRQVQDFLLMTSILNRLTGPLCQAVTGLDAPGPDGRGYVPWLVKANLFTVPLDDRKLWFRYHNLFQEYLQERLARTYAATEIAELHRRAGGWYGAHGFVDEAISHALASGDQVRAAELVEEHRYAQINLGRWSKLEGWLSLLPPELIGARPELVMLQAWILHARLRVVDIPELLEWAQRLLEQTPPAEGKYRNLAAEMEALAAEVFCWSADPASALAAAERALAMTPTARGRTRAVAWICKARALLMAGEAQAAFDTLYEALEEDRMHGGRFLTSLFGTLAAGYWAQADTPSLLKTASQLVRIARERSLAEDVAWGHYYEGCAYYQQDNLAAAEKCFAYVFEQRGTADSYAFAQSAFGLASVYQAQGSHERARTIMLSLARYGEEKKNTAVLADTRAFQAQLALASGQRAEAARIAASCQRDERSAPMPAFHIASISLAKVMLGVGTAAGLQEARSMLAALRTAAETTHHTRSLIEVLALQGLALRADGGQPAALAAVRRAIDLARPGGLVRVFLDLGPRMAALLEELRRQDPDGDRQDWILRAFLQPAGPRPAAGQGGLIEPLSPRELEVLALLSQRWSNREIGGLLGISDHTVKRHTMNIYQKLAVQNRREAVETAIALGILPPPAGSGPQS